MVWGSLDCKNNESKAAVNPLPEGPYLVVNQHKENGIKGDSSKNYSGLDWVEKLPDNTWGKCAFINEDGKMRMVFYHWDTT